MPTDRRPRAGGLGLPDDGEFSEPIARQLVERHAHVFRPNQGGELIVQAGQDDAVSLTLLIGQGQDGGPIERADLCPRAALLKAREPGLLRLAARVAVVRPSPFPRATASGGMRRHRRYWPHWRPASALIDTAAAMPRREQPERLRRRRRGAGIDRGRRMRRAATRLFAASRNTESLALPERAIPQRRSRSAPASDDCAGDPAQPARRKASPVDFAGRPAHQRRRRPFSSPGYMRRAARDRSTR